jgi:uncharacterized membrane protein
MQKDTTPTKKPAGLLGMERINGFSDGVFAIVITLLVLEIKVPEIHKDLVSEELIPALKELAPNIVSHAISFALLGIYWVGHHTVFRLIKRYDRTLLWLNLLYLLFVASMPFPTGLVIRYGDQQISLVIYCGVLILAGLSAVAMWWHASRDHRLIDENISQETIAITYRRILTAPALYLVAILVSFISVAITQVILVLVIVIYLVPNPLTVLHIEVHGHHHTSEE